MIRPDKKITADIPDLPQATSPQHPIAAVRALFFLVLDLAVAFTGLYACLFILDMPLLDTYPERHLKTLHYPNLDNVYRDEDYSRYHINSYGLIGSEPAPLVDRSVFRIAMFGDSFVEAIQVSPDKKFAGLLERQLLPTEPRQKVEVWNFGYSADYTGNQYARWLNQASKVSFDLVIFSFNDGDMLENRPQDSMDKSGDFLVPDADGHYHLREFGDSSGSARFPKLNELMPRFHYFNYLLRTRIQDYLKELRSSLGKWLESAVGFFSNNSDISTPAGSVVPRTNMEQIQDTFEQLMHVQNAIEKAGVPTVILGLPTDVAAPPGFGSHRRDARDAYLVLAAKLSATGIPFVDAYPWIAADIARGNDPYSDWEPYHHYNVRGHALVADALSEYFASQPTYGLRRPARSVSAEPTK